MATAPPTANSFVDTGLKPRTAYSYSVFASYDDTAAAASTETSTIDSARITGHVTDADGDAAAGVRVRIWFTDDADHAPNRGSATTDQSGGYTVDGLVPGVPYHVCFDPSALGNRETGLQRQCWRDRPWDGEERPRDIDTITVAPAEVRARVDVRLARGGALGGHAVDSAGHGVGGVAVVAYTDTYDSVAGPAGRATTAADGSYRITGLTPSDAGYYVCFAAAAAAAAGLRARCHGDDEWSGRAYDFPRDARHRVAVTAGQTRTAVDVTMPPGADVSGRVVDASGRPVAAVTVRVNTESSTASATSDAQGRYVVRGLADEDGSICTDSSTVPVSAAPTGFVPACGPVKVTGSATTVADIELRPGAAVRGTVTSVVDGAPIPSAHVYVLDGALPGAEDDDGPTATTDAAGRFQIRGVDPRSAGDIVSVNALFARGGPSPVGYLSTRRTGVDLTTGTTTSLDFQLVSAAVLTGRVRSVGGTPLGHIAVQTWLPYGDDDSTGWGYDATTQADGVWSMVALPAVDAVRICFAVPNIDYDSPTGYYGHCLGSDEPYTGAGAPRSALATSLSPGEIVGGLDVDLSPGAAFSGTLTRNARTTAGIFITTGSEPSIVPANIDANGRYLVRNLPPLQHLAVCFGSYAPAATDFPECWQGQAWNVRGSRGAPPDSTTRIDLVAGETRTGIDADVSRP